jgi:carbonic anhydrase
MSQDAANDVIAELRIGNQRFRDGRAQGPRRGAEHRRAAAAGQAPKAAVLTCSDSRVSPELLFDQGIGDLFVVRTAGHVIDRGALGSLEYAVEHLHVLVVLVLGHSGCGAVTAAVAGQHGAGGMASTGSSARFAPRCGPAGWSAGTSWTTRHANTCDGQPMSS